MPTLDQHDSNKTAKILVVGDSGTGKTGMLASLVDAGYKLRILDVDNGLDSLAKYVKDKSKLRNVAYQTITQSMKKGAYGPIPKSNPDVFPKVLEQLNEWKETDDSGNVVRNLGPVTSWGEDTVLVIDSLTMLSNHALWWARSVGGNMTKKYIDQADWGLAMQSVEGLLSMLSDAEIKCNVIVISHIVHIGDESNPTPYPSTLGQKLPPKVGRYFNTMLMTKIIGSGTSVKRVIKTVPDGKLACKIPVQGLKPELPIEDGLLTIMNAFKAL